MRVFLALPMMLLPAVLPAATLCTFTQECFEGEACADSAFEMRISLPLTQATVTGRLVAETGTGTFPGYVLRGGPEKRQVFFDADTAGYMLTLQQNEARLAVHIDEGPLMVNYIGTCEATE